jgi:hypothetical protein
MAEGRRWRNGLAASAKRQMDELGELLGRVIPRIIAVEDLAPSDRIRVERFAGAIAASGNVMATMSARLGDFEAVIRLAPDHLVDDDTDRESDLRLIRMSHRWIDDEVYLRARLAEIESGPQLVQ